MTSLPLELVLELDAVREPISGRVRYGDGNSESFCGWMQLTRAIEGARIRAVGESERGISGGDTTQGREN